MLGSLLKLIQLVVLPNVLEITLEENRKSGFSLYKKAILNLSSKVIEFMPLMT